MAVKAKGFSLLAENDKPRRVVAIINLHTWGLGLSCGQLPLLNWWVILLGVGPVTVLFKICRAAKPVELECMCDEGKCP